jgi:23S rRNA (adenine-N6)-dimethyltransferase
MPRSRFGGRHELGQNFLHHRPTVHKIAGLVAGTTGPILEIGAGNGALTRELAGLGRPVTAIDIDEHHVARLRRSLPGVAVEHADVLRHPLRAPVVVGNIPFHITTPILRRLLTTGSWRYAILLTQWEVARKRAGVGGTTMMTAQSAPWFTFALLGRVPSWAFTPQPSVDGGILSIQRRASPLVSRGEREAYERFVRTVFTGSGRTFADVMQRASGADRSATQRTLAALGIDRRCLPRDLDAEQWARLWRSVQGRRRGRTHSS